jgi:CRP-like cAMP-binding protein
MVNLRSLYESMVNMPEQEWNFIAAHFSKRIYAKGEVITDRGQIEGYLSFIERGAVRYYLPGDDHELTFNFGFDMEFVCAYDSFLTQTPSEYALQTLTDTTVWRVSHEGLQQVYTGTSVGNYLGRFAAEKLFLTKSRRELSLLKYNARERYLLLFDEQPNILKRVPLKYIASYIGITPQALSRIRKEII